MEELCTAPGGAWRGGGRAGCSGATPPRPRAGPPKPPLHPRRRAPLPHPPLLTLLPSHLLHLTASAPLGKPWPSPVGRRQCKPHPRASHTGHCSPNPLRPSFAQAPLRVPKPGVTHALARPFSDLVTDLQVPFPSRLGEPAGLHALRGILGSPDLPGRPVWVPVPSTKTTRSFSLVLGTLRPTLSCHDQEKPALLTLGACLQPHHPSGSPRSPGPQDCAQPTTHPRCTCFYLLRAGRTWCTEGEGTPTLSAPTPHPAQDWDHRGLSGMASPPTTESQSQSPQTHPPQQMGCGPTPGPLQPDFGFALNLERTAAPWLLGSQLGPLLLPWNHQALWGPLSLRHSWTHPVPSTLSPHGVLIQSAPFYYYIHKITPTPSIAPAPTPKGG